MTLTILYTIIGIAIGVLTLGTAFVKAIYKVARLNETMERVVKSVDNLAERVETLDNRIYDNAVRGAQGRR